MPHRRPRACVCGGILRRNDRERRGERREGARRAPWVQEGYRRTVCQRVRGKYQPLACSLGELSLQMVTRNDVGGTSRARADCSCGSTYVERDVEEDARMHLTSCRTCAARWHRKQRPRLLSTRGQLRGRLRQHCAVGGVRAGETARHVKCHRLVIYGHARRLSFYLPNSAPACALPPAANTSFEVHTQVHCYRLPSMTALSKASIHVSTSCAPPRLSAPAPPPIRAASPPSTAAAAPLTSPPSPLPAATM